MYAWIRTSWVCVFFSHHIQVTCFNKCHIALRASRFLSEGNDGFATFLAQKWVIYIFATFYLIKVDNPDLYYWIQLNACYLFSFLWQIRIRMCQQWYFICAYVCECAGKHGLIPFQYFDTFAHVYAPTKWICQ